MPSEEIIASEMHNLREELRDLKSYQFKLLSIAAVVTGFLLSLTRLRLDSAVSTIPAPSLYLLPLVVVVPSWFIFFDKAKTITRIVGYYRNAEAYVRKEGSIEYFPGWERSLGCFRQRRAEALRTVRSREQKRKWISRIWFSAKHFFAVALLIDSQRYWTLAYYTFLALSAICLWVPIRSNFPLRPDLWVVFLRPESILLVFAVGLTLYCAVFNSIILSRLVWGEHSYDFLEKLWQEVLIP